jgi:hypothetical protein
MIRRGPAVFNGKTVGVAKRRSRPQVFSKDQPDESMKPSPANGPFRVSAVATRRRNPANPRVEKEENPDETDRRESPRMLRRPT